jgi:MOSC domain-containing protein YiiM
MSVVSVNVGRSRDLVVGARRVVSAIGKQAVTGPREVRIDALSRARTPGVRVGP